MKKLNKFFLVKSIDVETRTVRAYVSDFKWDRDGERFAKGAWLLENYKKNPVVLFAHNGQMWPVGKCVEIIEDENGLLAVTEFAETEEGEKAFKLFAGGFLNAFSVGFMPKEIAYEDISPEQRGRVFTRAELLEYSVVPVPANPGACVTHELADFIKKAMGENFVKQDGEKFILTDGKAATPAPTPEAAPEPSIDAPLKAIIDHAKAVKFKPTDAGKLKLVKSAITVLQEILAESEKDEVSKEEFDQLKASMASLADCVKKMHPSKEDLLKTVLSQLDKALNRGPEQK